MPLFVKMHSLENQGASLLWVISLLCANQNKKLKYLNLVCELVLHIRE